MTSQMLSHQLRDYEVERSQREGWMLANLTELNGNCLNDRVRYALRHCGSAFTGIVVGFARDDLTQAVVLMIRHRNGLSFIAPENVLWRVGG